MTGQPTFARLRDVIRDADDLNEGEAHTLRALYARCKNDVTFASAQTLADDMKVAPSTVNHRLASLKRKGYLHTWQEPGERGQYGRCFKQITLPPVAASGTRSTLSPVAATPVPVQRLPKSQVDKSQSNKQTLSPLSARTRVREGGFLVLRNGPSNSNDVAASSTTDGAAMDVSVPDGGKVGGGQLGPSRTDDLPTCLKFMRPPKPGPLRVRPHLQPATTKGEHHGS